MKVAALYDIHGNSPALEAVLTEVRRLGVDLIVVGGDVVPGPMPIECCALLREIGIPARFIRGNGDRVVLAARAGGDISEVPDAFKPVVRWTAEQISDEVATWMHTWPATLQVNVGGIGEVLFCHASPRNDTDIFTRVTPDERLQPLFNAVVASVVICGHTHMQFERTVGRSRVVNAGSVGMPFQPPAAYWLLLDGRIELRDTAYDVARAAHQIRRSGYPQAVEFADRNVLTTPSESTMLEMFEKTAVLP
jgi:putative phosphoesterase